MSLVKESASAIPRLLREEIAQHGPISFSRFMELSLYHPQCGYYRRDPKPIGKEGDFFTASQLQPVFGRLMRQYLLRLHAEHAPHLPFAVLELGPGRGEMREAFEGFSYRGVDAGEPICASGYQGFLFGNELFDALPVEAGVWRADGVHERRVTTTESGFQFAESPSPNEALTEYARRFDSPREDGFELEAHFAGISMLKELLHACAAALLVFIDYGYTRREWRRFPSGTLMAYRKHQASAAVLSNPGAQDITAHVPFDVLAQVAGECGARVLRLESLAQALLFAGEADAFAEALRAPRESDAFALRQQLKLLLYGMGESFRVLVLASP